MKRCYQPIRIFWMLLFIVFPAFLPARAEDNDVPEKTEKTEPAEAKIKLAKPVEEKPNAAEAEKEHPKPTEPEQVIAVKKIEVVPPAKTESGQGAGGISLGASLSLMNTSGQIHDYLDTTVGFGLFAQLRGQDFPIALFAQAGYFNASSYRVQSMSFLYGQAGIGWPIEFPFNLSLTPYFTAGIHGGKYQSAVAEISTNFLLASFDLGGVLSYAINREIGIVMKGGFMPVLDKVISTNFWHIGVGATYAL